MCWNLPRVSSILSKLSRASKLSEASNLSRPTVCATGATVGSTLAVAAATAMAAANTTKSVKVMLKQYTLRRVLKGRSGMASVPVPGKTTLARISGLTLLVPKSLANWRRNEKKEASFDRGARVLFLHSRRSTTSTSSAKLCEAERGRGRESRTNEGKTRASERARVSSAPFFSIDPLLIQVGTQGNRGGSRSGSFLPVGSSGREEASLQDGTRGKGVRPRGRMEKEDRENFKQVKQKCPTWILAVLSKTKWFYHKNGPDYFGFESLGHLGEKHQFLDSDLCLILSNRILYIFQNGTLNLKIWVQSRPIVKIT